MPARRRCDYRMRRAACSVVPILPLIFSQFGCAALPNYAPKWPRTITVGDQVYEEVAPGDLISWACRDPSDELGVGGVLVEPGIFSNESLAGAGFVLFDGTDVGVVTQYQRKGIHHRWDWGENLEFAFVIEADGTGLFYDFTVPDDDDVEGVRAREVFQCKQKPRSVHRAPPARPSPKKGKR